MKIAVIGDIHGRNSWEKIVSKDYDKIVFIGDYVDSYEIKPIAQLENLQKIKKFKEENENVILLLGNHDYHYLFDEIRYSGYQIDYKKEFQDIFKEMLDNNLIQASWYYNDVLFTHAGVTDTWIKSTGYEGDLKDIKSISEYINDLLINYNGEFHFKDRFFNNPYGNDIFQSPIWIRPQSLLIDRLKFRQVVGHTSVDEIEIEDYIAFIDSLKNDNYLEIDNNKFKPTKI